MALGGGDSIVKLPHPHYVWPCPSNSKEKKALSQQRDLDISIKGRSGPIKELEDKFLEFLEHQRRFAITFNSGTSALLAAYFALGLEAGDEVICPAITFHAAVTPLYFLRANPVLVDVSANDWCLDPSLIEEAITPQTKAITVVHQWGHPAPMKEIMAIARRYNLAVIEDCSHAHGSRYHNQLVGTFGDIAVFSLQANKLVFAGEGGILVTNSPEYHDRATLLGHYRDRAKDEIIDQFYQQFWTTGYGMKLRMSPYNAITALYSLQEATDKITQRQRCLTYFSQQLLGLPEIRVPKIAANVDIGAWYGYKPRYLSTLFHGIPRDKYISALQAEGVEIDIPGSPAFTSLPLFTVKEDGMFRDRSDKRVYKSGDFPIAEMLASQGLSLPTFSSWPKDKTIIDAYVLAFKKVHNNYRELL